MSNSPDETTIDAETLALRAADGCLESFRLLVERYQVSLVRYLHRWSPTLQDAEDLAQETFVKAYRYLARFDPQWRFSTWLFTIGRRLSINAARRPDLGAPARSTDEHVALQEATDSQPEPAARIAAREGRNQLWEVAAATLSREQYDALWLFYVEGFSVAETAQVLDRTTMAIKSMLFRARQQLRPQLTAMAEQRLPAAQPAAESTDSESSASSEEWDHVRVFFTP